MNTIPKSEDLATLTKKINHARQRLQQEKAFLFDEVKPDIDDALNAAKTLSDHLHALVSINIIGSGGTFISNAEGAARAEAFQNWIDTYISIPDLHDKLSVNNFALDAKNIRSLLDGDQARGGVQAERLLIYPALNGQNFTLVFASGNKDSGGADKVIRTKQGDEFHVLDEIEPCKGSDCPKIQ